VLHTVDFREFSNKAFAQTIQLINQSFKNLFYHQKYEETVL